jgi:hypothetical protein
MRIFLTVLVLIISIQSLTKADNIKDFQIDGISLGSSLLDFLKVEEIENSKKLWYPSKKFYIITVNINNNQQYDIISIALKNYDNNYIIKSISGSIFYQNNIELCAEKKNTIVSEISQIVKNSAKINDVGVIILNADSSGKSTAETTNLEFDNGDLISVQCKDWGTVYGKKKNFWDNLQVSIVSKEYYDFTLNEKYK